MALFGMNLSAECEKTGFILYEAISESFEVLPTVVYPPSGGERMPEKSLLTTYSLGKTLTQVELKQNFLQQIYAGVLNGSGSCEPFYAQGIDYLVRTPDGTYFLVFYENDKRLSNDKRGMRFRLNLLQKIAKTENLFVESAKGGGTSHDETILGILRSLESKIGK